MSGRLDGKVAIVTGGGRGVGRGIVERFLEEGAEVVVAQRGPLPDELAALGGDRLAHRVTDLTREDRIEALMAATADRHGRLDILVNNAGLMFERSLEEMTGEHWDAMMVVNLKAPFLLCKYAVPALRKAGGSAIINIGSIEGLGANPGHAAYCASKGGIHGLTRALAVDLGVDGIRCNAIAPGWIRSDLSDAYLASLGDPAMVSAELKRLHPAGRLGLARDVGEAAVYLASDAAAFVTGQVFVIDGGRTAKLPLPGLGGA